MDVLLVQRAAVGSLRRRAEAGRKDFDLKNGRKNVHFRI